MTTCAWTNDGEKWDTACGQSFCFINDGPYENNMKFCCYCGLVLEPRETSEPQICHVCDGDGVIEQEVPCSPTEATGGQAFFVARHPCESCNGIGFKPALTPSRGRT